MYFDIELPDATSKEFQKHAYQFLDNPSLTLVHYIGDEKVAVDFAHRSKKRKDVTFIRTCPSALQKFKTMCQNDTANAVYKKEIGSAGCNLACTKPRNLKQLRNIRYQQLHLMRISKDDLYNIHEIAYDVSGFVWRITTYPNLVCIVGLQEILEEMDECCYLNIVPNFCLMIPPFNLVTATFLHSCLDI